MFMIKAGKALLTWFTLNGTGALRVDRDALCWSHEDNLAVPGICGSVITTGAYMVGSTMSIMPAYQLIDPSYAWLTVIRPRDITTLTYPNKLARDAYGIISIEGFGGWQWRVTGPITEILLVSSAYIDWLNVAEWPTLPDGRGGDWKTRGW